MAEQWNHPEERPTWTIGPYKFTARRYNGGWIYWGMLGLEEVMSECYDHDLQHARHMSLLFVTQCRSELSDAIQEFQP